MIIWQTLKDLHKGIKESHNFVKDIEDLVQTPKQPPSPLG